MRKQRALDLINKLSRAEASLQGQEFLAPLVRRGRARLRIQGLIYELALPDAQPGWWICRMLNAHQAECIEEALPWQRGDYLARWPALRLVLLEPLRAGAWLALPYNPSDAAQRFGLAGPLLVQLVEQGQPFERIIGRVEGQTIWYDEPDRRADLATAEALRETYAASRETPGLPGLGAGEQAAYLLLINRKNEAQAAAAEGEQAPRATAAGDRTEQRLRHALEIGGARLLGYRMSGQGLQVIWERDGQRSVVLVDDDLSVVAAGICLSGEDRRFDLASIVGVVRDSPAFARYDEEWDEET